MSTTLHPVVDRRAGRRDGHTIDVGYVHVLEARGGACVNHCPHPDHAGVTLHGSYDA